MLEPDLKKLDAWSWSLKFRFLLRSRGLEQIDVGKTTQWPIKYVSACCGLFQMPSYAFH